MPPTPPPPDLSSPSRRAGWAALPHLFLLPQSAMLRLLTGGWRSLYRDVQRFRGGLVFESRRLVYHSNLGLRVIQQKKRVLSAGGSGLSLGLRVSGVGCRGLGVLFTERRGGCGFSRITPPFVGVPGCSVQGCLADKKTPPSF